MTVTIDTALMDGVVRGGLDYLRSAIAHRVEENRGTHLITAVSLMLGIILKLQDEPGAAV